MQELKEKLFTTKTAAGCRRLLALCLCIILVSGFLACLISTDGFKLKTEKVTIDARGAALNGELYYPSNTSSKDSLPAIIVIHGGGSTYGAVKGIAEELARRGFVVLNMSAYGSGLSQQPFYDDNDQGAAAFNAMKSPQGCLDALNFVRSLKFVDATRVGMVGHSMGSRRTCYTAIMDCGYFSYNDIMINVLHDTFGLTFTKDEINTDAAALAKARLSAGDLKYYNYLAQEKRTSYDTRLKSILSLGGNANLITPLSTVTVGGIKVSRSCQINMGVANGLYDSNYSNYNTLDATKKGWYTGTAAVKLDSWYVLNDVAGSSSQIGNYGDASIASNAAFLKALYERRVRMCTLNQESHSKNVVSSSTNEDVCAYFTQTLSYNCGNLSDKSTVQMASTNQVWYWRELLNAVGMLAMLGMLVPLAALLMRTKFFQPIVAAPVERKAKLNKKSYLLFAALAIVFGFLGIYYAIQLGLKLFGITLPTNSFWSLAGGAWSGMVFLLYMAMGAVVILVCLSVIGKKKYGETGLKALNVGIKFKNIMKTLLLVLILLAAAYSAVMMVGYLFNEDFRCWQLIFTEMPLEYWGIVPRYVLTYIPFMLLVNMAINYAVRDDIPEWKDTLITVAVNTVGIWLCCLINTVLMYSHSTAIMGNGWTFFASFLSYYYVLLTVPITVYINRKMYKLTNSVWLGVLLNCVILCWAVISASGINNSYTGTTFAEVFFGY